MREKSKGRNTVSVMQRDTDNVIDKRGHVKLLFRQYVTDSNV